MAGNLNNLISFEDFQSNNIFKLRDQAIIDGLVEKKYTFVSIVECIGLVLTDDSKEIRGRGIDFLTWIIDSLPPEALDKTEVSIIAKFYGERLQDHHSVLPKVLRGTQSLVKHSNITSDSVCDTLHKLFQFVACQSQVPHDRWRIYNIIEECGKRHFNCVQNMGPDFIYGVLSLMDGETDPKNLLLLFKFLPSLLGELNNIDNISDNIFEVLSTYFPVDFTSVTKNGITITREELADGLSLCLSSRACLSLQCIPLTLEKLDSSLKVAKVDSYQLLRKCFQQLNASQLEPFLNLLWKSFTRDLLPPGNSVVQEEALQTLMAVVSALQREENNQNILNSFLDDVIISVRSLLPKPNDSLFGPSMKILLAICSGSKVATIRVFLELEALCKIKERSSYELRPLITSIISFLPFGKDAEESLKVVVSFCILCANNDSEEIRCLAFTALQQTTDFIYEYGERDQLFKALLMAPKLSKCSKPLTEYYKLLRNLAKASSEKFHQEYLTPILTEYESGVIAPSLYFEIVGFLLDVPVVMEAAIPHILSSIAKFEHSDLPSKALLVACENSTRHEFFSELDEKYNIVESLLECGLATADLSRLSTIALVLVTVVSRLDYTRHEQLVEMVMSENPGIYKSVSEDVSKVILLEGIFGGILPDIKIPNVYLVLPLLMNIASKNECGELRFSASRLLAALVNKMPESVGLWLLDEINQLITNCEGSFDNIVALWCWLLKGAILRGLPRLDPWLCHWFSLLEDLEISYSIAAETSTLIKEETMFLTTKTNCTVRFLYRQRLFSYVPQIMQSWSVCDPSLKDNHLLVLITLARSVPKEVLSSEPLVARFVAQAMLSTNLKVLLPALDLLKTLLEDRSPIFTDNITALLPAILRFTTYTPSLTVRKTALHCMFLAGFYTTHHILPFKRKVEKALIPCLDDKKRTVRAEAIRARSRWCLVGAVGADVLSPDDFPKN